MSYASKGTLTRAQLRALMDATCDEHGSGILEGIGYCITSWITYNGEPVRQRAYVFTDVPWGVSVDREILE